MEVVVVIVAVVVGCGSCGGGGGSGGVDLKLTVDKGIRSVDNE